MMFLRRLYQRFLSYREKNFLQDANQWLGVEELGLSKKEMKKYHRDIHQLPFLSFAKHVKDIVYSKNVFDFMEKNGLDAWDLWYYLDFLSKEGAIRMGKDGRVRNVHREIRSILLAPKRFDEIQEYIQKKLKVQIKNEAFVSELFRPWIQFEFDKDFDEYPISQDSALFTIEQILKMAPLRGKILFVGDDDFLSVLVGLIDPKIQCTVIDVNKDLLDHIDRLALKFHLNIETKLVDVMKGKRISGAYMAFVSNPIDTTEGTKAFLRYGLKHFSRDGGFAIVPIGYEHIGREVLSLQKFFTDHQLKIHSITPEKIFFPFGNTYPEDVEIAQRFQKIMDKKIYMKNPILASSLYILEYLPGSSMKKQSIPRKIYSYL